MTTPFDALIAALEEAGGYNSAAESPPEAILWCDANGDFFPLLPGLRERLPHLLTFGDFDAATRTGPAVWLRAAVARALADLKLPDNAVAIVYLPGIGREILRGAEDCPPLLQPLVWFTVAGSLFGHVNGKDWTLRGFLAAERGKLKLEIDEDQASRTALAHAAVRFCTRPLEELRGKRWDADALNALLAPDLTADMLDWMDGTFDSTVDAGRFAAFAGIAAKELGFDPSKLSRQDAAHRLAQRQGKWSAVWARFASSTGYDGVVRLLAAEEPPNLLADKGAYPRINAREEKKLREELLQLINAPLAEARSRIQALDNAHAWRRDTVWARRGEAPLAAALESLAEISAAKTLPTHDGSALAEAYAQYGWAVDWAAIRTIAAVPREIDRAAVITALRAIYIPWLDEGATALQELVRQGKVQLAKPEKKENPDTLLFVDGLRMDLAHQLVRLLRAEGAQIDVGWAWSGFPTVTATCKPLVSPIAEHLRGSARASDLAPMTEEGKAVSKPTLFKGMEDAGWETQDSLLADTKLWTEAGRFDEEGHALGARVADRIVGGIRDIADRALALLRSGRRLRIVTDHGWLLVPGGLQQAVLDPGLVEPQGKRSRCAIVKSAAQTSYLQVPWTWNDKVFLASATGARAFFAGQEYAHGGISPQECVLPVLEVAASGAAVQPISITRANWEGLRLRIEVTGGADHTIDVRLGAETSGASLVKGGRVLDEKGRTSVLVSDLHEGKQACLVVVDDNGSILAHRASRSAAEMFELDELDKKAAAAFPGHLVRKDLVRRFRGQFPVPTYVVEFMLGRYCASTDAAEIEEGLQMVQQQLSDRSVRAGEEELFKARARERGSVRIIDIITARLDAKSDSYFATLPSLRLTDVRIADKLVKDHERMLTGGFYAEIELGYDASIAQEKGGRPFEAMSLREIQLSSRDILEKIFAGRGQLTSREWKDLLLRSVGLDPSKLSARAHDAMLLRMVPFVERNYNMVELGPRGTGKSHLYQQVSPYAHLISGGKATVARMFVNMANGQRGLVCQYDVVCFDEVSGVSFDQKDGVNIMKGYMESGEFSRGRESIRAEGSIVLVGNFEVDVQHQQRVGHLFGSLPPEMRNDTAFMDRIHAYLPGWDLPKVNRELFTDRFGLVSDVLAECFSRLRSQSRVNTLQGRVHFGGALSGRDQNAVNKTISGLLKLIYPDPTQTVPDEDLEWAVRLSLELRRRVKEQQKRIGSAEFRNTQFSYVMGLDGVEKFVSTPELQSEDSIGTDPLPSGQVWAISPGGQDEGMGLFRIEVTESPGGGVRILNQSPPNPFKESVRIAEQNLYSRATELVGDRNPREHEFAVQLRSFDSAKSGAQLGVGVLAALCSALLGKPLKGGLAITGGITLGGSIEPIHNPIDLVELAFEKGATAVMMPVSCRRALIDLSDDVATKVQVLYYSDAVDALRKAVHEG